MHFAQTCFILSTHCSLNSCGFQELKRKQQSMCLLLNAPLSRGHLSSNVTYQQRTKSRATFLMNKQTAPPNPRSAVSALCLGEVLGVLRRHRPRYLRRLSAGPRSNFLAHGVLTEAYLREARGCRQNPYITDEKGDSGYILLKTVLSPISSIWILHVRFTSEGIISPQ